MTANQFRLLNAAIRDQQSLVAGTAHQSTIQSCQRHGWLAAKPIERHGVAGFWYPVTEAGLEALCNHQHIYFGEYAFVEENIFLKQIWIRYDQ